MKLVRESNILLVIVLLLSLDTFGQNQQTKKRTFTVSGYITDSRSGETMINASVYDANTYKGSTTNSYGYYTLPLPEGNVRIAASYVGYKPFESVFNLTHDTVINIKLDESIDLEEVVVVGKTIESNVRGTQMSTIDIPIAQIKKMPTLFGETDILKTLQLLPGVQSGTEGSAGLYVRGGGPDENLILLDGVPLYNVNHMMGFFSAFNADAVKNVTLYKGNFPARFGGRLSSVIDVRMKDGDMYNYHGNASIGIIAARVNVEGPIIKGKTSFNFSFRRTYYDILASPIIKAIATSESDIDKMAVGYYFYDANLKINHKFSDKDRLFFSIYSGDDVVYFKTRLNEDKDYKSIVDLRWFWGNKITALRWNHVVNPKLFMDVTATYTQYRHKIGFMMEEESYNSESSYKETYSLGLNSGIYDGCVKVDFGYIPHEDHDIKFGANATNHVFSPSSTAIHLSEEESDLDQSSSMTYDTIYGNSSIRAFETALFFEDNWTINNFFKLNAGLHYSTFSVNNRTYQSLQPRVSLRTLLSESVSIKVGYAYMSQYIHLLSSNNISLPTDLWVPVTENVEPMHAHQVAAGVFYDWKGFEFSSEVYYKYMNNVLEYKDGASFFSIDNTEWEQKIVMGEGFAYGIEFLMQKSVGNTTGWIGYTLAKTERLFNRPGQTLNFGEMFPAKYDRRHDLSITVSHKLNERIDLSATWIYSSGNCGTLATQYYTGNLFNSYYNIRYGYISSRNNYRYNSYQRLDIGVNFNKVKRHGTRTWSFNIYNTLNHNNPFIVYTDSEDGQKYLKQVCIFPIMPSLSYSYKF